MARWHSCNVLRVGAAERHVWQFNGGDFSLNREQSSPTGEPLPASLIHKDWRALWQRKLNIAWLPPEQVFLRVAQFPQSSFEETRSMVEFQLEKLSPIPVTQAVWSMHIMPHASGTQQTVILAIASRSVVEEFLGQLEGQGFLADRLELPMFDQLQSTAIVGDGAWVYPLADVGSTRAVVAWWYGGVLHNIDLLNLPGEADRVAAVRDQLTQMAWAGELEGWLTSPPQWHLVAEGTVAGAWEPVLREAMDQPVDIIAPMPQPQLAALTAKRAAGSDVTANLLPPEFATRYQQQFVDRLWMRGLFAVIGLYVVGVAIFLIAVQVLGYQTGGIEKQVRGLSLTYTNALQTEARYDVLKERKELKEAALQTWLLAAANLPENLSLDSINFSDGRKASFSGTASPGAASDALGFYESMRKAKIEGQPFFKATGGEPYRGNTLGGSLRWDFSLELRRSED